MFEFEKVHPGNLTWIPKKALEKVTPSKYANHLISVLDFKSVLFLKLRIRT